jgi:protein transport protein SEC61 subunit gamma-like protein
VENERAKKKHWSYFFGIICVLVFFGGQKTCLAQDSAENFISLEFFGILSSLGVQEERKRRECKELGRSEGKNKMEAVDTVVRPVREFTKDSIRLVKKCHKPDRREFSKVAIRTAIGFIVMGFIGFFVKLIFIPINNIIVGSG